MATHLYTNLALEATPSDPKHLVNLQFVEDYVTGKVKAPVRVIANTNQNGTYAAGTMTFTYAAFGIQSIDATAVELNNRVLLNGQTDARQNGVYTLTTQGDATTRAVLTRASDFNSSEKIYSGVRLAVNEGAAYQNSVWALATDAPIVLDTSDLTFVRISGVGGPRKFVAAIIGDGLTTEFDVTHNLGTQDVIVQVCDNRTLQTIMTDITLPDDIKAVIGFAQPPESGAGFQVIVIG